MLDRKERWFGRSLDQWLVDIINESNNDAISLQQVNDSLREDFQLNPSDFKISIREVLGALHEASAFPVVWNNRNWEIDPNFSKDRTLFIKEVTDILDRNSSEATLSGIWFSKRYEKQAI